MTRTWARTVSDRRPPRARSEWLRSVLQREPGIRVVGEARNGREAVELCRSLGPDLVLMDVRMPEMDGLEATRAVKRELPETGVLMVTMHENRDYILEATKAGAAGYVLKDASRNELISAVRRVVDAEPSNSQAAQPGHGVFS